MPPLAVNCMPETPPLRAKDMLEVPLEMGERPEALQPGRERELETRTRARTAMGARYCDRAGTGTKHGHKGARMRANASLIGRRDSRRTKSFCPLGRDKALGVREEGHRRRTFSNRKGLKRSSKRHSGHRRLQQEATWPPCKSEVSQTAPVTATTTHLYPDSITQSSHRPMFSLRNPLTFAFEAHPEGTASSWRRTIMQRCCTMASRRVWWPSHPVTPPSRVFPHCPRGLRLMLSYGGHAVHALALARHWHNILGTRFCCARADR